MASALGGWFHLTWSLTGLPEYTEIPFIIVGTPIADIFMVEFPREQTLRWSFVCRNLLGVFLSSTLMDKRR